MNDLIKILELARKGSIRVDPVVIVDWHDGPLSGIARMSEDSNLWRFKIFAEAPRSDDVDDRLFLFAPLPDRLRGLLDSLLDATSKPVLMWPFDHEPDPAAVSSLVDMLMEVDVPERLVVSLGTFDHVAQVWLI